MTQHQPARDLTKESDDAIYSPRVAAIIEKLFDIREKYPEDKIVVLHQVWLDS